MRHSGQRRKIPEVIQTSGMDCGPAALKALLEGLGISVSYGRLREACQTDVDGTSIDTLEEIAKQLGVDAEQVLIPFEQLVHDDTVFPALAVVRLPSGLTHFVVLWRRDGDRVEIMDPAVGRRTETLARLREELYIHFTDVPAEAWREWAGSEPARRVIAARLAALGLDGALLDQALADPTWRSIAALDAALRMVERLVRADAIAPAEGKKLVGELQKTPESLPYTMWSVVPAAEPEQLNLRGAVMVCARGRLADDAAVERPPLPADLAAALAEKPTRLGHELWRLVRHDGLIGPAALVLALAAATLAGVFEALIFRGFLDVGRHLGVITQRLGALVGVLGFLLLLALLEAPIVSGAQGLGRRLEARLRMAFLAKIPRLGDRYFHSRPVSDMAERGHALHVVRTLPVLATDLVRGGFELLITTLGLAWIDPRSAPLAVAAAVMAVVLPALAQRGLTDADLRQRSHAGALSRFYLDALLGLVPVRTHGAGRAVRREHESLLVEWMHAGRSLLRSIVRLEALQALVGFAIAGLLLFSYLWRAGESASILLFVYWALNLPVVGHRIALALRQVPAARNIALRLAEPLGAREEAVSPPAAPAAVPPAKAVTGVALTFDAVEVIGGGHRILGGVDLTIAAGEHVAVVGPSGAGKSTLVGLLLGWHQAASGRLLVDGHVLDAETLAGLRATTAWADPEVQLWNRSLLDNLRYGADLEAGGAPLDLAALIDEAGLRRVLENLPEGLQTHLGEGGGLVSGGEGQRVRFARALNRRGARLAVLDEAFRGHDHETRQALLRRARAYFARATLVCITHDVGEALTFGRVLVVDGGQIVEDGAPAALDRPGTRFRALLDAERAVRESLWAASQWRHLRLHQGRVIEPAAAAGGEAS